MSTTRAIPSALPVTKINSPELYATYNELKLEGTQTILFSIASIPKIVSEEIPYLKAKCFAHDNKLMLNENEKLFLSGVPNEIDKPVDEKMDFQMLPEWIRCLTILSRAADNMLEAKNLLIFFANSKSIDRSLFAQYLLANSFKKIPSDESARFVKIITMLYGNLTDEVKGPRDTAQFVIDLKKSLSELQIALLAVNKFLKIKKEHLLFFLYRNHVLVTLARLEPHNQKEYLTILQKDFIAHFYYYSQDDSLNDDCDTIHRFFKSLLCYYPYFAETKENHVFFGMFIDALLVCTLLFSASYRASLFNSAMKIFLPHMTHENWEYLSAKFFIEYQNYVRLKKSRYQNETLMILDTLTEFKSPEVDFWRQQTIAECYALHGDLATLQKAKNYYEAAKKISAELKLSYQQPDYLLQNLAKVTLDVNKEEAKKLYKEALAVSISEGSIETIIKTIDDIVACQSKFEMKMYDDIFNYASESLDHIVSLDALNEMDVNNLFYHYQSPSIQNLQKKLIQVVDNYFSDEKIIQTTTQINIALFYSRALKKANRHLLWVTLKDFPDLDAKHKAAIIKTYQTFTIDYNRQAPSRQIFGELNELDTIKILQDLISENCIPAINAMMTYLFSKHHNKKKLYLAAKKALLSQPDSQNYRNAMAHLEERKVKYALYVDAYLAIIKKAHSDLPLSDPDDYLERYAPDKLKKHFREKREQTTGNKHLLSKTSYFKPKKMETEKQGYHLLSV